MTLSATSFIKAADLKIDGLLNLGDSWSYEYRILRSDTSDRPLLRTQEKSKEKNEEVPHEEIYRKRVEEIAREKENYNADEVNEDPGRDRKNEYDEETAENKEKELALRRDEEIVHYNQEIARQNDEEAERIQRDAEHLSLAEHMLRDQADRLRLEALSPKADQMQNQDRMTEIHYIHNPNKHKTVSSSEFRIPKWSENLNTETVGRSEARIPKRSKLTMESVATNEATTEDSSYDDSHNSDNPNKGSMKINYEKATEDLKNLLRDSKDHSDTQDSRSDSRDKESQYSSDISAKFKEKFRQSIKMPESDSSTSSRESKENIIKINKYTTPKYAKELINKTLQDIVNKTILQHMNKTRNFSTVVKVTTVRTGEIFTNTHKVMEEKAILEFTIHLYMATMKIFGRIKNKTDQEHVKHKIDSLMKSYQDKFQEFINETNGQEIKTRLGTQKVILNTIDTSYRLLRRLMNFLLSDLDKKGILRQHTQTAKIFQNAIELEITLQSLHACKKFGICRSLPGFSSFLADTLDIVLSTDDKKLKQTMDAFTEVIKYMRFPQILEPETEKNLKKVVDKMEKEDITIIRAVLMLLRNTIKSQNKPLVVSHYTSRRSIVNSTLAFLEVIDLLDMQIPPNRNNSLEWADVKHSLQEYANGKRTDIQDIMAIILRRFRRNLRSLDKKSKTIISKNLDIILSHALNLAE